MDSQSHKKALKLSYITLGYTLFEGTAAVVLGVLARSTALTAFGLDSFIESLSGSIMVWRFSKHSDEPDGEEQFEKKAITYVAYTFFILSAYILYESIKALYFHEVASPSPFGIALTILAPIAMFILFLKKNKLAKEINSKSLEADSKQALACAMLSITTLIGLGLNYFGLWWADPIAAIIIAVLLLREGYETYQKQKLCNC